MTTTRHQPLPPGRRQDKCVDCHQTSDLHSTPFGLMCRTCAEILAAERRLEQSE